MPPMTIIRKSFPENICRHSIGRHIVDHNYACVVSFTNEMISIIDVLGALMKLQAQISVNFIAP
jgi:hypothetical protein